MQVERGQRQAHGDDLHAFVQRFHQGRQRWMALEDDLGAESGYHGGIPAKLQRVPETLLGMDQHRFPGGVLPLPLRLQKISAR